MTWQMIPFILVLVLCVAAQMLVRRTVRLDKERKAATTRLVHLVGRTRELEAEVSVPLVTLVAQAEEKALLEWQLQQPAPVDERGLPMAKARRAEFSDCINCGKEAIYVMGQREPVAWVLTDACADHAS